MADKKKVAKKPPQEEEQTTGELPDDNEVAAQVERLKSKWGKPGNGQADGNDAVDNSAPGEATPLEEALNPDIENPDLLEVEDGSVTDTEQLQDDETEDTAPVYESLERDIIKLPKRNCMRCLHLMPNHPGAVERQVKRPTYRPIKGKEGTFKRVMKTVTVEASAKIFGCFNESICPARVMVLAYDPYTDEVLQAKVDEFMASGDAGVLGKLYAEAESVSPMLQEQVHERIMALMRPPVIEAVIEA